MRVQADLRCYHCGHVAARVEGDQDQPYEKMRLVTSDGSAAISLHSHESLRCDRCGGPLYRDAFEIVRYESISSLPLPPSRRGRPRKWSSQS